MKIKLLTSLSGEGFSYAYNDETDKLSDEDCKRLIEKGLAEEVKNTKPAGRKAKK